MKRLPRTSAAKEDWLGKVIRWWEFICASCGDSGLWPGTLQEATGQANVQGWRKTRGATGLLWECGGCIAERQKREKELRTKSVAAAVRR